MALQRASLENARPGVSLPRCLLSIKSDNVASAAWYQGLAATVTDRLVVLIHPLLPSPFNQLSTCPLRGSRIRGSRG